MLGTSLWLVVTMGLLAAVLLDAAAAFGRASVHAAADHAIEAALHDAVADYQNRLQDALAHDTSALASDPGYASAIAALPNPLQRTYPPDGFVLEYDVTPTTAAAPACARAAPDGLDAIGRLQCHPLVRESRMSLRIVARVRDASGAALLAQREQYVTLRLFAEPPFSTVTGRKDASAADPSGADALAPPAHEGDAGGAGGTLIHVRYECHDGAGSCANAAPPDPDADLRAGTRWTNGNRPSP